MVILLLWFGLLKSCSVITHVGTENGTGNIEGLLPGAHHMPAYLWPKVDVIVLNAALPSNLALHSHHTKSERSRIASFPLTAFSASLLVTLVLERGA